MASCCTIECAMKQQTSTILIVWADIPVEVESDFNDWYSNEHLPDRIGRLPGFVRGRRFALTLEREAAPKYLTLYDLTSAEVMLSPTHVELRKHRKPRDLKFVPLFRNTIKGICDVVGRVGEVGAGEWLVLLPVSAQSHSFTQQMTEVLLPRVSVIAGVNSVTLAMCNATVTASSSARDDRSGDRYVDGLIVVETANEVAAREAAALLTAEQLARMGGAPQFMQKPAVFRMIHRLQATADAFTNNRNVGESVVLD